MGKGAGEKVRSRGGIWGGGSELQDLELGESLCGLISWLRLEADKLPPWEE